MPFTSRRAQLELSSEDKELLTRLSQSRSETAAKVQRAQVLLRYHSGETISSCPRAVDQSAEGRALCEQGPGAGRAPGALRSAGPRATQGDGPSGASLGGEPGLPEAQGLGLCPGVVDHAPAGQACAKPLQGSGRHPSLARLSRGTVSKILSANPIQPHKIRYYLERRDPEFEAKMAQVLHVYRTVELWRQSGVPELMAVLSFDEKPGIQAIANTAPDLPPVPGRHATLSRDHEYVRHGTLSLLAAIDLLTGEVVGVVRGHHRSR